MGIDKANVRFVVHYNASKSLEAFYQESGRAGRDGKQSWSIVYSSKQDIDMKRFLATKSAEESARRRTGVRRNADESLNRQLKAIDMVEAYSHPRCRRVCLLQYFGEPEPPRGKRGFNGNKACCDFCTKPDRVKEVYAKQARFDAGESFGDKAGGGFRSVRNMLSALNGGSSRSTGASGSLFGKVNGVNPGEIRDDGDSGVRSTYVDLSGKRSLTDRLAALEAAERAAERGDDGSSSKSSSGLQSLRSRLGVGRAIRRPTMGTKPLQSGAQSSTSRFRAPRSVAAKSANTGRTRAQSSVLKNSTDDNGASASTAAAPKKSSFQSALATLRAASNDASTPPVDQSPHKASQSADAGMCTSPSAIEAARVASFAAQAAASRATTAATAAPTSASDEAAKLGLKSSNARVRSAKSSAAGFTKASNVFNDRRTIVSNPSDKRKFDASDSAAEPALAVPKKKVARAPEEASGASMHPSSTVEANNTNDSKKTPVKNTDAEQSASNQSISRFFESPSPPPRTHSPIGAIEISLSDSEDDESLGAFGGLIDVNIDLNGDDDDMFPQIVGGTNV